MPALLSEEIFPEFVGGLPVRCLRALLLELKEVAIVRSTLLFDLLGLRFETLIGSAFVIEGAVEADAEVRAAGPTFVASGDLFDVSDGAALVALLHSRSKSSLRLRMTAPSDWSSGL